MKYENKIKIIAVSFYRTCNCTITMLMIEQLVLNPKYENKCKY